MDLDKVTKFIKNLGFPVVVCVACAWYIQDTNTNYRQETRLREERMLNQIDGFQSVMDNFNTTLININGEIRQINNDMQQFKEELRK